MGIHLIQFIVIGLTTGWPDAALAECGTGCSTCGPGNGNSNRCTNCLERYYLTATETCVPCPDKCRQCLGDNSCTLCDSPYFGSLSPHCNRTCPNNCNSSGCDAVYGFCFGCQQGFYGAKCVQNCDLCTYDRCDRFACSEGCKLGYYQIVSSAMYSDCLPCKDNCAICSNFTHCTSCQTGFVSFRGHYDCQDCKLIIAGCKQCSYGSGLIVCDACQDGYHLQENTCVVHTCPLGCSTDCHNNGTCIGGCKAGYAGEKCDILCNAPCKYCDQSDKNKCLTNSCNINYDSNCVILTGRETCNKTGFCLNGCLDGYWDITCNRSCNIGCIISCDRMTGECYKCEHMRYGKVCDKNCSENCLNNDTLHDVCTKDLGKCLQGCKPGFAGTYCTQATPIPTQDSTSLRNNVSNFVSASMNSEDSSNVPVIAGASAGAGVVFLGVAVGITYCLYRRSKQKNKNTQSDEENIPVQDLSSLEQTSGIVHSTSTTALTGTNDYIYAQPNKTRKSQTSKADSVVNFSNNRSMNLQEDGRQDTEDDISEDDALEELDEDSPNNETDIIPTSDIYYNMASLKRSRIMVTELNDYIKGKADFGAEFEKLPSGLTRTCNEALKPSNRSKNRYNKIYPFQCFSKCPDACTSCMDNTCYACEDGYFLYNGDCPQCPITCRICQSQDICTDCQPNYWNLTSQCDKLCPSNCYSNCNRDTGYCFSCKSNFYGYDCAHDCTLCRYGNCNYQGCISGCYDGYFQDDYQGYSVCRPCSSNCSKCGTFYNCTECQPYFYLYKYGQFNESRSECKQCTPGCAFCYDVDRCSSCEHIKYCKECQYSGISYTCSVCENGYTIFGGQCFAEKQCPFGCLSGCDIRGVCFECKHGFTGSFCNNSCSDLCFRCSKESSDICEQCKDADLFTPMCTEHCTENCLKITGYSTCQLENGYCLNGCRAGTWGIKCENNCSKNCLKKENSQPECSVLSGSCYYGCMTGFTGLACDSRITTTTDTLNTTYTNLQSTYFPFSSLTPPIVGEPNVAEGKTYPLAAVLGASAGGIVIGAASVIVVFVLWKRLRKKPQFRSHVYANTGIDISQHDDNPTSLVEMNFPSSESPMYERLSSRTNECNYSVLTK